MYSTIEVRGNVLLSQNAVVHGNIMLNKSVNLNGNVFIATGGSSTIPIYAGPYEVTPTQSTQVLLTNNKKAIDNITVNPIRRKYGKKRNDQRCCIFKCSIR